MTRLSRWSWLVLGVVWVAFVAWALMDQEKQTDYWRGRAAAAEAKLGSACAPVFGVFWIERSCTGWAGLLPAGVQSVVCPARIRAWRGDLEPTRARFEALGPNVSALMLEERGPKEREVALRWRAELSR